MAILSYKNLNALNMANSSNPRGMAQDDYKPTEGYQPGKPQTSQSYNPTEGYQPGKPQTSQRGYVPASTNNAAAPKAPPSGGSSAAKPTQSNAFASNTSQIDGSAATTPPADVFARRERQPTPFSVNEPRRRTVFIQVGNRRGVVTYLDDGTQLRPWLATVLRSLSERWGLEAGWDSYDAEPTHTGHAARLLTYLFKLMGDSSTPPIITPLWDGGVQATWHRNNKDLEVVVSAEEPPMYYFHDGAAGEEEEDQLEPNFARVRALISQF